MRASLRTVVTVTVLLAGPAWAQGAHDTGRRGEAPAPAPAPTLTLAQRAAKRWPQPVRVGDLVDRQVLEPSNHQGVLGRVSGVSKAPDGALLLVFRYGGVLGLGTRTLAVPVEATTLLGQFVQIVDVDQATLAAMPAWTGAGVAFLAADEIVRIGINRN